MSVWLARHGQTDYNAERRFQGQGAVPLNATGIAQAHELARNAAAADLGFVALWCSPLARAHQTAQIVGETIGLAPVTDARFMETDTGDWTDLLFDDVEREDPEGYAAYYRTDPAFAFPGGESLVDQTARVLEGVAAVQQGPQPALIVCHRGVIRCLRAHEDPRGLATFMAWDVPNGSLEQL